MRHRPLLGVLALVPVALNVSGVPAGFVMAAPICSGGTAVSGIIIPHSPAPFRSGDQECCIKGCHTGTSRRRSTRHI